MKRERDKKLWIEEMKDFKLEIEKMVDRNITETQLKAAIDTLNAKRKSLQRLNALRHKNPSPISGRDMLLIQQIAFYDIPERFTDMVNKLCDELEARVQNNKTPSPPMGYPWTRCWKNSPNAT